MELEPETAGLVAALVVSGGLGDASVPVPSLEALLATFWEWIAKAANERFAREGPTEQAGV